MIEELSVRNFALIDSLTLSFENGFTVLTGETGAGKSIIVGSLSFLLGAKVDTDLIRSGSDEADVSAVLSVSPANRDALDWLRARDIETDEGSLIVRRSIKKTGRNSIFIQNIPVSRNDLAEFMILLFDLHGQHSHESLLRRESHRLYLDRFAGLEDEAGDLNRVFRELADKRRLLEASLSSERDRADRLEMLNYAVDEIDDGALKKGELRELQGEAQRLADFEKLAALVNTAAAALFEDEGSVVSLSRRLKNSLANAAAIDGELDPILKRVEDLFYEAEDLAREFHSYREKLTYDPDRLEWVEERLATLYKLKKKYGVLPSGAEAPASNELVFDGDYPEDPILAYRAWAAAEIELLLGAGESRETLKGEISALEKELLSRAAALSAHRKLAARNLGQGIAGILSRLGMPNAVFSVSVEAKERSAQGKLVCGPWGIDEVEFMISANAGEPLKDLARIASGGELSRVMLAVKTVLLGGDTGQSPGSGEASAETLVFDEIDTGIGGEVALAVGEYLAQIAKIKQIFCVTHLASIAVRADNHLKVEKKILTGPGGERTVTGVVFLSPKERRQEIARMLSGGVGAAALAHADELLRKHWAT